MKFCSEVCCILTHFHSNLGSRGGKYWPMQKYAKNIVNRWWRQKKGKRTNPAKYNKYLENERLRKNYSNLMKVSTFIIIKQPNIRSNEYKSIRRSIKGNHKTSFTKWIGYLNQTIREPKFEKGNRSSAAKPKKKIVSIQSLASKCQVRIKMHKNRGHLRKELSEEKKDWMIEFLNRSDMTYINPGR